jgi:hypothetical protein
MSAHLTEELLRYVIERLRDHGTLPRSATLLHPITFEQMQDHGWINPAGRFDWYKVAQDMHPLDIDGDRDG